MPEFIQVILLGIVEGLTEFLPISSTGHLIVASALLNFQGTAGGTFEIFIQFGAVIAVIIYFRNTLIDQLKAVGDKASARKFWANLAIAFVPAAAIGFIFSSKIKELLFSPVVVAISLIVGGIIFLITERVKPAAKTSTLADITPRQALWVGLAQITALIPGVSRSGSTIVGGMFAGLSRSVATEFSFYLAIPVLGLATLYDLVKSLDQLQSGDLVNLAVGAVVSGIVAWISIRWLLNFVAHNTFVAFGYYRILAGVVILLLIASQTIK